MQQDNARLTISTEGDATVVRLNDRKILDEVSIAEIGEQINELVVAAETPTVVLDFVNVAHMSSSALGMLITLHKRVRERNGQLRLCCIQPAIYEIFVITRLNEIFHICQSLPDALEGLK